MPDDKLESLREHKSMRWGCRICGKEPTAAVIRAEIKRPPPTGKRTYGPTIDSRQISVCEDCALKVWPQMRELLP